MNPSTEISGYQIIELVGEGAFGSVYRARQMSTGQDVAIKLLRTGDLSDGLMRNRLLKRLRREIGLCARLNHPHIVRLIDSGIDGDGLPFAVFEYVKGETLHDLLKRNGPLPAEQLQAVMEQVLEALAYAHEKGIIHRDLKPGNIIIASYGSRIHAKIVDFGIGGFLSPSTKTEHINLTLTPEGLGTPSYAAPEQLRGEAPDPKSDVYAWGLIFLECLTGEPVITGSSTAEIFQRQLLSEDIPLPAEVASHPVSFLLRRVLAKSTRDRVGDTSRLLTEYRQLHLGDLEGRPGVPRTAATGRASTPAQTAHGLMPGNVRHQLTVLCCSLCAVAMEGESPDPEVLDSLQRMQNNVCADIAAKYSGYLAGGLGNFIMFYFGYPESCDEGARLATMAALDLADDFRLRNRMIQEQHNSKLLLRAGIHSGLVSVEKGRPPSGNIPDLALRLAAAAASGQVLISGQVRDRLIEHMIVERVPRRVADFFPEMKIFSLKGELGYESFNPGPKSVIFGREKEAGLIVDALRSAQNGKGRALLVKGDAGIGKSALVRSACGLFENGDVTILRASCFPEYRNSMLFPISGVIRRNLGMQETMNPAAMAERIQHALKESGCDVEKIFPVFCIWFSIPPPSGDILAQYSPQRQKELLFEGLSRLLFFRRKTLQVLVMEDLHWADPLTLEYLDFVMKSLDSHSLIILGTARTEFESVRGGLFQEVILLDGLSCNDSSLMLEHVYEDMDCPPDWKIIILKRAGGVPLFIRELAKSAKTGTYGKGLAGERIDTKFIPARLDDLLNMNLRQTGPAMETAILCSIMGPGFDYDLLSEVSMLDEESLRDDLDVLIKTGILFFRPGTLVPSIHFVSHCSGTQLTVSSRPLRKKLFTSESRVFLKQESRASETKHMLCSPFIMPVPSPSIRQCVPGYGQSGIF